MNENAYRARAERGEVRKGNVNDTDTRLWHPWLRIQLLLHSMLGTRWNATTWPTVKAEMKKALEKRSRIQRAGWFN